MNLRKQTGRSEKRIGRNLLIGMKGWIGMITLMMTGLLMMGQTTFAQYPGSGGAGRQGGGFGAGGGSIGHFYGRIVDAKTDKGMDGVSVQLVQSKFDTVTRKRKDTVIAGMITGRKGDFSLENLPLFGNFRIRITAIGYKTYEQRVAFEMKMPQKGGDIQQALAGVDKDLGNIKLSSESQTLEQVTVTASKPLISMGVDRKIYNVEKDISAQGGTGVDVMKNVPSVQVDIDGNVTLRNSPPTIFVDGRPTTLTLDQIPADAIASVEIITNPGAKYDASGGTSGILNIVLKKNRKAGYNGNIRAGLDQRGKLNLGADINVKQGKVNFFANANYGQRKSISPGTTTRYTFPYSSPVFPYKAAPGDSLIQNDYNVTNGYFAFGRGGLDYLIDNRNTLSISGTIVHGTFKPYTNSDLYVDTLFPNNTTYSYTRRLSNTVAQFNNHGGMLSFKHTFPRSGEEWTADANYSSGSNDNTNNITSTIFPVKGQPANYPYSQQQLGSGTNKYFTAQTDFVLPINDKSKFETGARIAIRNNASVNDLDTLGRDGLYHVNELLSTNYSFRDRVFAGYVTYSNAIHNFNYQLGLRAESSDYKGTENYTAFDSNHVQQPTIGYFSNQFPISLFPSIFLTQKLGDDQDLALNYTRRIDRPNFFQLFPFTDYSDSLNISRGNPGLQPQFTNSLELSYQKNYAGNNTFLASVYYKSTTNLITRYQVSGVNPITDSTVFINTYVNAKSSFVGGLELIGRNTVTRWWDITSNLNFFTSKIDLIDTGKVAIPTTGQLYSWFGKINNTFKLPKNFTLQLSGDYTSKTVLPPGGSAGNGGGGGRGFGGTVSGNAQGYSRPSGGVDAALKYEFLKNKAASLTLSVSDIFRTRVYDVFTSSAQFDQEAFRRRDPQFFRLQFNYRFGKFDVALFKRKNMKSDMENLQGSMQGVQAQPQ
ncbi:MAG: outer membrane beta-barrel family protein [Bacteroidota bacterium]|nr:outer membrane beta-barrel family protein [Bacteroidota bacterium]MDP4216958.1 outer membrane beta-barrel family protein [Bacteroidota bacterium]MDP4259713.1 outer membrane beta-barrel family protein [Bacteroidota bacterium]